MSKGVGPRAKPGDDVEGGGARRNGTDTLSVMAGLVPAIHVLSR